MRETLIVADAIVVAYLFGWALTTAGLIVSSRWLMNRWSPASHPVAVSFLAGAAWPLLLLGAIELGAVVAGNEAMSENEPGYTVIA